MRAISSHPDPADQGRPRTSDEAAALAHGYQVSPAPAIEVAATAGGLARQLDVYGATGRMLRSSLLGVMLLAAAVVALVDGSEPLVAVVMAGLLLTGASMWLVYRRRAGRRSRQLTELVTQHPWQVWPLRSEALGSVPPGRAAPLGERRLTLLSPEGRAVYELRSFVHPEVAAEFTEEGGGVLWVAGAPDGPAVALAAPGGARVWPASPAPPGPPAAPGPPGAAPRAEVLARLVARARSGTAWTDRTA
ncbi:hypothetical protein [Streptomyces otsuchiensis]|uniref:hypothetical protein n=1 Tax=Streptomyces otsuchiensis TaxID=2681388 RepID=UPI0010311DDE|nr:hypothetical protein [Streptomyces otsuchiensis]